MLSVDIAIENPVVEYNKYGKCFSWTNEIIFLFSIYSFLFTLKVGVKFTRPLIKVSEPIVHQLFSNILNIQIILIRFLQCDQTNLGELFWQISATRVVHEGRKQRNTRGDSHTWRTLRGGPIFMRVWRQLDGAQQQRPWSGRDRRDSPRL